MNEAKPFEQPITVSTPDGPVAIATVQEALDLLSSRWPGPRDGLHRDAVETCLKVLDGHRSTIDGQTAFLAAAQACGLLLDGHSATIKER